MNEDEKRQVYFEVLWPDDLEAGGTSQEVRLDLPGPECSDEVALCLTVDDGYGSTSVSMTREAAVRLAVAIIRATGPTSRGGSR